MSTSADASAAQVPEIGSEEWVAQKLAASGVQADDADAPEESESQAGAQATDTADGSAVAGTPSAPSWREAAIPTDDETVPQHFRGKPVATVYDSYRELERQFNDDRKRLRELEAKVAAKETFKELLAEQAAAAKQPTTLADPYAAAGVDLDTDPVLNPRKFVATQEQVLFDKFRHEMAQERERKEAEDQKKAADDAEVRAVAVALEHLSKERNLNQQLMEIRIPSILMTVGQKLGKDGIKNPDALLAAHDEIFGKPVVVTATPQVPNPPGVKRPVAVDSPSKPNGPQLKSYERELLSEMYETLSNELPKAKIDPERLAARYALQLKKARS